MRRTPVSGDLFYVRDPVSGVEVASWRRSRRRTCARASRRAYLAWAPDTVTTSACQSAVRLSVCPFCPSPSALVGFGEASGVMVHDDGTIDGAIPGPVFVVGHLATPGWLAVLAGPLLGSRGVLESMSGWNAAGTLLAPSLLGSSLAPVAAPPSPACTSPSPARWTMKRPNPQLRRRSLAIGSGGAGVTPLLPVHVRGGAPSTA